MNERSTHPLDEAEGTFLALVSLLTRDEGLSPRGAVVLDFCGKAMGVPGERRRALAHQPSAELPEVVEVLDRVELQLEAAPEEVRHDVVRALEELLGIHHTRRVEAPFCPVCKHRDHPGVRLLWTPPPGVGLGPLEGSRQTSWICLGCQSLLDCLDRLEEPLRSRSMKIRVTSPEMQTFLRDLRAAGEDPGSVVRTLSAGPTSAWLLERVPGVSTQVWTALGRTRDHLLEHPEQAAEAYTMQGGVIRMGPPGSAAIWQHLLHAELPDGLLARLARQPGAPGAIRRKLVEHPEVEVRHQALQAPDIPTELLEERLDHGDTVDLLSILDRSDVGPRTLERAIARGNPHVLYRTGRHGSLDLLLLAKVRAVRRRDLPALIPASRVLHVYAPGARRGGSLVEQVHERLVQVFAQHGYEPGPVPPGTPAVPALEEDGTFRLVCSRASLSRLLVHLPAGSPGTPGSLDLERLVETMKQVLTSGLAEEVVELTVDEGCGYWQADIRQRGSPPQHVGATDLPPPDPEAPSGRWLEFELFCSERALAYPGIPAAFPGPRLITRAPYAPHPPETEWTQVLGFAKSSREPPPGSP